MTDTQCIVVEEHVIFTLDDLCRATGARSEQLLALVHEGVLEPAGSGPEDWRFSGPALPRARAALRLLRDFELDPAAAALVLELLGEIEQLRARLQRIGA